MTNTTLTHRPSTPTTSPGSSVLLATALGATAALLAARNVLVAGVLDPVITGVAVLVGALAVVAARGPRWVGWLGGLPLVALLASEARPEIAFYLDRPSDRLAFVIVGGLVLAAATALMAGIALAAGWRLGTLVVAGGGLVVGAMAAVGVVAFDGHDNFEHTVSAAERAELPRVELLSFGYGELPDVARGAPTRFVAVNDTTEPHTFSVPELGIDVYVPVGGDALVELHPDETGTFEVVCTIDGHVDSGMTVPLQVD